VESPNLQVDQPTPANPAEPVTVLKLEVGTEVKPASTTNGIEAAVELERKSLSTLKSFE